MIKHRQLRQHTFSRRKHTVHYKIALYALRQYRIIIVERLLSQIFRQIV